ncbi:MAG TPA: TonB-dependent receptor [Desulfuromonadaceae bacterium]|jgi:vitamin B12 transporter
MPSIKRSHNLCALLTILCLALCLLPYIAWGEDDEETLGLFNAWQESSTTASRAPKPLSQTAENVTIVTAKEIEALNAHTLADVLDTIPGIQTWHYGGPGSVALTSIQSSANNHMLVMVDGAPLNSLAENVSDISLIPARIIERIEIIKGAASSAWGQALAGVINVITKTPVGERAISGSASASIGERTTTDSGVELSGTSNRLGYYLSGGYLGSNGLLPHITTNTNNAYIKLAYDLPDRGQLWGTFRFTNFHRGDLYLPDAAYDFQQKNKGQHLYATLGYHRPLTEHLEFELTARHASRDFDSLINLISDPSIGQTMLGKELASGVNAKLVWRGANNLLVAGADYEHAETKSTDAMLAVDMLNRKVDRWGIYLNDTITLGPVSVSPGARFDHSGTSGDQFSPALGATWQLTDSTLLRGYTARGYSIPNILLVNAPSEKIWTAQIGIESSAVPYLWLKGTLFRNEIWNIGDTHERRIALGSELEARTTPVWNTSLGAGWTFTDTYRTSDGSEVTAVPRHTVQLALRYDDQTYRGLLTGHHILWNSNIEPGYNGKYYGLIWDLHLSATLLKKETSSLELFFSGHNLFKGSQSWIDVIPNTGRWFDGGMRVRF